MMIQKRKDSIMSLSPIEQTEMLRIGTVDFVSPDEIKVALDIETPESMAMNAGYPRPFPRVNSYVLIQSEDGFLVGQVEWITIEKSPYPKRQGMKDFGLVDLPYPLRKMSLNPLGMLRNTSNAKEESYAFRRGTEAFPSVGDGVLLPSQKQLKSIVESGENRRVKIGTSPLAGNADVCIDPDRLFGRHLAVLGNTGSGKSCTVAGLIRWSLEAAMKVNKSPNARFIILDPNGEYSKAFSNTKGNIQVQIFKVENSGLEKALQVPLWLWNSSEWSSITQATVKTQRPLIQQALRSRRNAQSYSKDCDNDYKIIRYIRGSLSIITQSIAAHAPFVSCTDKNYWGFIQQLNCIKDSINSFATMSSTMSQDLKNLALYILDLVESKCKNDRGYNKPFEYGDIDTLQQQMSSFITSYGSISMHDVPIDEDTPIPFQKEDFLDDLSCMSENSGNSQWFEFFLTRIKTMLSNKIINQILNCPAEVTLDTWLSSYLGSNNDTHVAIVDLSLVPLEIIHIVTAVISRMIFEALQRYRKMNSEGKTLPTVLVMEEAHTFVKKYNMDSENQDAASLCCQVFEKIAREGRKFGLGLVLSSQRPSELSPTVLSQCNTFLLHRISNDRDQELVRKLVPDNLRGLLRDLPTLPSQNAILLGWASELPVLVRMNDLPSNQTPKSDDPDFWDVWTRSDKGEREVNWKKVADDWQGKQTTE